MSPNVKPDTAPPLRILHLEDAGADRLLIRRILEAGGLACDFTYALTQLQYEEALAHGGFDLILADYTLPGYNGLAALALAQAKQPDVPYLFVSGTMGEQPAIDSLKSGATDYVLKEHLERLVPAVRRALREAEERRQRRRAEEALRTSEQNLREMAENIRDVFWSATPDAPPKLLYVSPAYEHVWGRPVSELHARPASWLEAVSPADLSRVQTAMEQLAKGLPVKIEFCLSLPDGTLRWIENRGYAVHDETGRMVRAVGIATDITERKRLAEQLQQAQKIESIGQLAGGVAHDFNNVLTVINGRTSLLLDYEENLPARVVESLEQIYVAGERAASLTRQLLVFSRQQAVDQQPIDLNEMIDETAQLLGRLIGEHIVLELRLARPLRLIEADTSMMEQILFNLAVNARDAMPAGGQLTIATEVRQLDETHARYSPEARPGEFVCLLVSDRGCGIAPEVRARIFEPFFTTKEVGKGTGLGLATVSGIVKQHEGWIDVESKVGTGTTFRVWLPAASADAAKARIGSTSPLVRGGKEMILLVEDEASVREFAAAVLKKFGYAVLQATSGPEALEVWKWYAPRIVLLVTDIVMPDGLTGIALAEMLQKEKPALRVVLVSGYNQEMFGQVFKPRPGMRFIHKPFLPRVLASAVREALDSPVGAPLEIPQEELFPPVV